MKNIHVREKHWSFASPTFPDQDETHCNLLVYWAMMLQLTEPPSQDPQLCFIFLHITYSFLTLSNTWTFKNHWVACCLPNSYSRMWAQREPGICLLCSPCYHGVPAYSIKYFALFSAECSLSDLVAQITFPFSLHGKKFKTSCSWLCTNFSVENSFLI